ncbi:hypothetical protein [Haemophilus paraphrohaemolyticus]|nr:hypothetical protein [Haemophilus paraphrohaemolyticus]OOR93055.1 hypothetical protein B0184_10275 [Haemophilus paraphrohaemolyticus]STP02096.1 Uncharacterised protein [Haemophilus paraphrohaemolyticus]
MIVAILIVVILLAVLGLLFYWLKIKKSVKAKEENVNYGVSVVNHHGQLVNITDRPIMISDVINVLYNLSGSKKFNKNISSISVMANYEFDVEYDGKAIQVTHSGDTVFWNWVPAKALKTNSVSIFVFYN